MTTIKIPELESLLTSYAPSRREWTEQETEILRTYYGTLPAKEIAKYLKRSTQSVMCKATSMGLKGL